MDTFQHDLSNLARVLFSDIQIFTLVKRICIQQDLSNLALVLFSDIQIFTLVKRICIQQDLSNLAWLLFSAIQIFTLFFFFSFLSGFVLHQAWTSKSAQLEPRGEKQDQPKLVWHCNDTPCNRELDSTLGDFLNGLPVSVTHTGNYCQYQLMQMI